jgi:hypothetical protein
MTYTEQQSGIWVAGIWRFNRNMFTDEDFMPSAVTNHPRQIIMKHESVELSDVHIWISDLSDSS